MNFDHRLATMTVCMEAAKILYTWDLSLLDKAESLLTNCTACYSTCTIKPLDSSQSFISFTI